jgi:hypothetical protein
MSYNIKPTCFAVLAAMTVTGATVAQGASPLLGSAKSNIIESADPAAVELSRVLYQRQAFLQCQDGQCISKFAPVGANQRLELQHVSCGLESSGGGGYLALAEYSPKPTTTFQLLLGLASQGTKNGGDTFSVYQQDTSMYVLAKATVVVEIFYNGTAVASNCQIFGQMVTLK